METFRRWQDAEPVRLYIYGVLIAALAVLVAVGVVAQELVIPLAGLVAAVLMAPAAEAARSHVYSPATHDRELADVIWDAGEDRKAAGRDPDVGRHRREP